MSIPTPLVEIGFDITGADAPFFTLDDASKGLLDNTSFPLGGQIFFDVTDKVRSVTVRRGKNREFDQFDQGLANVVFDNNDRTFDPEFSASPFFGQVIPKRAIRVSSGGNMVFTGVIDDWNLDYEPGGDSTASAASSDAFTMFNSQTLPAGTATAQTTSARLNAILNLPDVSWPASERLIETGDTLLGADVFAEDANALQYMRLVAKSEPGNLFIQADGRLRFTNRFPSSNGAPVTFADDGSGIFYQGLKVVYGSELLFNEIVLGSEFTPTFVARDLASIAEYGVLALTQIDLLASDADYVEQLAVYYTVKYSEPEYRFESLDFVLEELSPAEQQAILGLEISDFVTIKFTPNGIPPAIVKTAEVLRIDHNISVDNHVVSIGFSTVDKAFWTLSDGIFGRLSAENVLAF